MTEDVYVIRSGQGARQALLIHCSLAHSGAWKGLAPLLGRALRLAAFDLPDHGRSADWDGKSDYHDLCTRIAGDLIGTGPVDLIGHSFGGTVALRLALEAPDRVRSLVLIEPVLFAAAQGHPAHHAQEVAFAPARAAWAKGDARASAQAFHGLWGDGRLWEALSVMQQEGMAQRIRTVWASDGMRADPAGMLAPGALEALGLPVLLVEGANSPPVISAINAALARRLPRVHRVVVPGAGHMVPITHPAAVAAAILEHLARSEPSQGN